MDSSRLTQGGGRFVRLEGKLSGRGGSGRTDTVLQRGPGGVWCGGGHLARGVERSGRG